MFALNRCTAAAATAVRADSALHLNVLRIGRYFSAFYTIN